MGLRQPQLIIGIGRRGSGKSVETVAMCLEYVKLHNRPVLIFDVNDEFGSFEHNDGRTLGIKALAIEDINKFVSKRPAEVRRIRPYFSANQVMSVKDMQNVLGIILKSYMDGLLLVEDINRYTSDSMKMDLLGSLATLRQRGVDVVMHYQLVQKAGHPKILGFTNYFRIHRTNDSMSVSSIKKKFGDKGEILHIAEILVMNRVDPAVEIEDRRKQKKEQLTPEEKKYVYSNRGKFFSVWVDVEYMKIRGSFTQKEQQEAIQDYIKINNPIGKMLTYKDRSGKKIYKDYAEAYNAVEQDFLKKYFNK